MTNYIHRIHNIETGEIIEKDYTADEIAAVEAAQAESDLIIKNEQIKAAEKAALLEQLGITEDQAKLLLA